MLPELFKKFLWRQFLNTDMLIGKLIGQLDHFIDQQTYNFSLRFKE